MTSQQQANGAMALESDVVEHHEPKYAVRDNCDRIRDEWMALERKWQTLRNEAERLHFERAHFEAHFLRVCLSFALVRLGMRQRSTILL